MIIIASVAAGLFSALMVGLLFWLALQADKPPAGAATAAVVTPRPRTRLVVWAITHRGKLGVVALAVLLLFLLWLFGFTVAGVTPGVPDWLNPAVSTVVSFVLAWWLVILLAIAIGLWKGGYPGWGAALAVFVLLFVAVPWVRPWFPCSATDIACKNEQAVQEEIRQQKQAAAAQHATEAARPRNTDQNCSGVVSLVQELDTSEVTFNPRGCFFYALGDGTVKFSGLFLGDLTVDLKTGQGDTVAGHRVYAARAAVGTVRWQYILCAGPKKDPNTLDCS